MDHTLVQSLEIMLYKKVTLYQDLLGCFKNEKESLLDIDLDRLWSISREKEELCSKIRSLRKVLLSVISPDADEKSFTLGQVLKFVPREKKREFHELTRTLTELKEEIEVLREGNRTYIDESLQFLDNMISIIAGETTRKVTYDDKCHLSNFAANVLLRREA